MTQRRLKLHRLVGIFDHIVGAGRGAAAGIAQVRRINSVGIIRMTLQAYLVFPGNVTAGNRGTGTTAAVAPFDDIADRKIVRIEIAGTVNRLHAPAAAECARQDIGMPRAVIVGAGIGGAGIVEQAVLEHAMRIVAIGAFDVTIAPV